MVFPFSSAERHFKFRQIWIRRRHFLGVMTIKSRTVTEPCGPKKNRHRFAALRPTCACCALDTWALTLLGTGMTMVFQCRRLSRFRGRVKRVGWHRYIRRHPGAARIRYRWRAGEGKLPKCFLLITEWSVTWEHAA